MAHDVRVSANIGPILGAIRSIPVPFKPGEAPPPGPPVPFITISREPGAGAWTLARQFVDTINASSPHDPRWTCWDRELFEKVAADMHQSAKLIEALEDRGHSWFSDFLGSLSSSDDRRTADAAAVYYRVAKTVRALALTGRAIIVGRGGVFITRKMSGGIHVRLVAPFEQRVQFMAREYHLTHDKAAARVKELEHNRQAFYRHYWPNEAIRPEIFTLTLNTAEVDSTTMVDMLMSLVRQKVVKAA
jgi:cytidylate kinase